MEEKQVADILRENNRRFRSLEITHGQLEQSLQDLNRRKILTPQEEYQKKTFQKKKLAAKDNMVELIRYYKATGKTNPQKREL